MLPTIFTKDFHKNPHSLLNLKTVKNFTFSFLNVDIWVLYINIGFFDFVTGDTQYGNW
jgi:hypothetical protein